MISLTSLWLPILVASALVFVASSIIHMLLSYHQNDMKRVPDEERVRDAMRPLELPPGDYMVPKPANAKEMGTPEYQEKLAQGPVVFMTVYPKGQFNMGKSLVLWFGYTLLVGLFAGYVASRTLPAGTDYMQVFRITGTVAFAGYGLALLQDYIWLNRNLGSTLKSLFDALIYALLTAGAFGWLWPA